MTIPDGSVSIPKDDDCKDNFPIRMEGGYPLSGKVRIQGSKNASLPVLAACILIPGKCILHNCPDITDMLYMQKLLESAGCEVQRQGNDILVDASGIKEYRLPGGYVNKMRSSIILMGALLGRMKEAGVDYPGGCVIGERPIDLHLMALTKLGARIQIEGNYIHAAGEALQGADIIFPFQSVGATQNAILAAVYAKGTTRLYGAANEPEVTALCDFLNEAGAKITGAGTGSITIEGVEELHETEYTVISDRIVAGTYLFAAMAAKGQIRLESVPVGQMEKVFEVVAAMGGQLSFENDAVTVYVPEKTRNLTYLETQVYPGFPTDLQSPLLAAACVAEGTLTLRENIFSSRFKIMEELKRMGADMLQKEDMAIITGKELLEGRNVIARELRGGAALIIAGLAASGITTVTDTCYIRRGYENIVKDFASLGARISEEKDYS